MAKKVTNEHLETSYNNYTREERLNNFVSDDSMRFVRQQTESVDGQVVSRLTNMVRSNDHSETSTYHYADNTTIYHQAINENGANSVMIVDDFYGGPGKQVYHVHSHFEDFLL